MRTGKVIEDSDLEVLQYDLQIELRAWLAKERVPDDLSEQIVRAASNEVSAARDRLRDEKVRAVIFRTAGY